MFISFLYNMLSIILNDLADEVADRREPVLPDIDLVDEAVDDWEPVG